MSNKKTFQAFLDKMEWEGGLVEVVTYGLLEAGDEELDSHLVALQQAIDGAENRIAELRTKYGIEEY